jgi:hypothetical protein
MESKKMRGKVPEVGAPQNNTYIEYCGMDNLGGKIKLMICSGAFIPSALFHNLF